MGGFRPNIEFTPSSTKRRTLVAVLILAEEVDLVDDEDYLLAPVPDQLEVLALGLGEGPVRGGDEEDEVRAGHEAAAELLVVADDGVGPRRVDDGDLAQEVVRVLLLEDTLASLALGGLLAVPEDRDPVGRRRHAFPGEFVFSKQGVYERGLTGVELADDDEQEQLFDVDELLAHERDVLGRGAKVFEKAGQAFEEGPFAVGDPPPTFVEDLHLAYHPPKVRRIQAFYPVTKDVKPRALRPCR
jgi:hypothetical protein